MSVATAAKHRNSQNLGVNHTPECVDGFRILYVPVPPVRQRKRNGYGLEFKNEVRKRNGYGSISESEVRKRNGYGLIFKIVMRKRNGYVLIFKILMRKRNGYG